MRGAVRRVSLPQAAGESARFLFYIYIIDFYEKITGALLFKHIHLSQFMYFVKNQYKLVSDWTRGAGCLAIELLI